MKVDIKLSGLMIDEQYEIAKYISGKKGSGNKKIRTASDNGGRDVPYFEVSSGEIKGNPPVYSMDLTCVDAEFDDKGAGQREVLKGLIELISKLNQKN